MAGLNLTRYAGEKVILSNDNGLVISVTVVSVNEKTGNVMLNFDAPQDINIVRKEIINREYNR